MTPVTPASAGTPASPNGVPLLELRDVEASYGPFRSLFGISLSVREGSVMALLGSNGSGKTTVVRVCCGLLKPTGGQLLYQGQDITGLRAYKLARIGIVHAPEGRSVFSTLTVEENLSLTFRQVFGRRHCLGEGDPAPFGRSVPGARGRGPSHGQDQNDGGLRALTIDPGDLLRSGRRLELVLLPGIADVDGLPLVARPGREREDVVDVLQYIIGG